MTRTVSILACLAIALGLAHDTSAQQNPPQNQWVEISQEVVASVEPGYPGKTAGVTVDPATGDLYMVIPDQGLWKSTDQGEKFTRADKGAIGGRCETGFALNFDPAGKRLMCFMIYGSSASTPDGGAHWNRSTTSHLDFGAVDWADTGNCFLSIRHESGGTLTISPDAGKTWTDLGKGFSRVGLFNAETLIGGKDGGLVRSQDSGKTWTKVHDSLPPGYVMTLHKGIGYWPTSEGLLVSRDQGKTWQTEGAKVSAVHGPYFGKTEGHMIVVGEQGFHESTDGGKSWNKVCMLPPEFKAGGVGPNYAWDSTGDIFYASSMGKPTWKYERGK